MQTPDTLLQPNEKILLVLHRHWFDILMHFLSVGLFLSVLFVSFFFLPFFLPELFSPEYRNFFLFFESLFFLFAWIYAFLTWIDVWFDMWIITSDRVLNIEQAGLFSRRTSELKFQKIQDVTVDVQGLFQTFLNFGDVEIQTAGEEEHFLFRRVPDPYKVKDLLSSLSRRKKESSDNEDVERNEPQIPTFPNTQ